MKIDDEFFDYLYDNFPCVKPPGMVLTSSGSSLEWIDAQPPRNTIHNAMKCDYCGSLHHDTRCPSCGAPARISKHPSKEVNLERHIDKIDPTASL